MNNNDLMPYNEALQCDPLVFAFVDRLLDFLKRCPDEGLMCGHLACNAQLGKVASLILKETDLKLNDARKTHLQDGVFNTFITHDKEWFFRSGDTYASEEELNKMSFQSIDLVMITICRMVAIYLQEHRQTSYTLLYALKNGSFGTEGSPFQGDLLNPFRSTQYITYLELLEQSDDLDDRIEYGLHYVLTNMASKFLSFMLETSIPPTLDNGVAGWVRKKCITNLLGGSLRKVLPCLYGKLPSYIEAYIASSPTTSNTVSGYDPITKQKLMAIATIVYTDPYFTKSRQDCMEYITTIKWMGGGVSLNSKKIPLLKDIEESKDTYEDMENEVGDLTEALMKTITTFQGKFTRGNDVAKRLFQEITDEISNINQTATGLGDEIKQKIITRGFVGDTESNQKEKAIMDTLFSETEIADTLSAETETEETSDSHSDTENDGVSEQLQQQLEELRRLLRDGNRRPSEFVENDDLDAESEHEEEVPSDNQLVRDNDRYLENDENMQNAMAGKVVFTESITWEKHEFDNGQKCETAKIVFADNVFAKTIEDKNSISIWTRGLMLAVKDHDSTYSLAPKVTSVNKVFYYKWWKIMKAISNSTGTNYCIEIVFLKHNDKQVGSFPILYSTDESNSWAELMSHSDNDYGVSGIPAYVPYVDINTDDKEDASNMFCAVLEGLFETDNDLKLIRIRRGSNWNCTINAGPQIYEQGYFQYTDGVLTINEHYTPNDASYDNDSIEFLQHVPFVNNVVKRSNKYLSMSAGTLESLMQTGFENKRKMLQFKQNFYLIVDENISPNKDNLRSQYVWFM